mmetsp:Transcript_31096/g.92536  ORF Transcript_31096/g.92536 Transcript_31096/m.92536 type:complete len:135 (+) Transcript_31096:58-462(+)
MHICSVGGGSMGETLPGSAGTGCQEPSAAPTGEVAREAPKGEGAVLEEVRRATVMARAAAGIVQAAASIPGAPSNVSGIGGAEPRVHVVEQLLPPGVGVFEPLTCHLCCFFGDLLGMRSAGWKTGGLTRAGEVE